MVISTSADRIADLLPICTSGPTKALSLSSQQPASNGAAGSQPAKTAPDAASLLPQRDADLAPFVVRYQTAASPSSRAAASAALREEMLARQRLAAALRGAVQRLVSSPGAAPAAMAAAARAAAASLAACGGAADSAEVSNAVGASFGPVAAAVQRIAAQAGWAAEVDTSNWAIVFNTAPLRTPAPSVSGASVGDPAAPQPCPAHSAAFKIGNVHMTLPQTLRSGGGAGSDAAGSALAQALLTTSLQPAGQPLVQSWECLRGMVGSWEAACGPLGERGLRHMRAFANLCNAGLQPQALADAAAEACASPISVV